MDFELPLYTVIYTQLRNNRVIIMKGYLLFSEQDLLEALVKDGRFDVENQDSAFWAEVCAARKDRR